MNQPKICCDHNNSIHDEVVVCLFDGSYNLGVAVLINSLVKSGFKGMIHAGYRDKLPQWVKELLPLENECFNVSNEVVIRFIKIDTPMHLGYYKPIFLKEAFSTYPESKNFYYFDADIIVKAPWFTFSQWLNKGVCLCLDNSFHFIHYSHPWRKDWQAIAPADSSFNNTNFYCNSGFIGVERSGEALIDRWIHFTRKYVENGGDITTFSKDPYRSFKGDQDLLNAAITISPDVDISVMGKEAMGFTLPHTMMLHAIGDLKPWNKIFLKDLFKTGHKPSIADKTFFKTSKFPLRIFTPITYTIKKIDLRVASFLGRFMGSQN